MDTPISESSVSLKLSLIQKRCQELLEDDSLELSLEETADKPKKPKSDPYDPYNRGS